MVSFLWALSESLWRLNEWASGWKGVFSCSCFVFSPCEVKDLCELDGGLCNIVTTNCTSESGRFKCTCLPEYVIDGFSSFSCSGSDHQMSSTDCIDNTHILIIITFIFAACPSGFKAENGKCSKWVCACFYFVDAGLGNLDRVIRPPQSIRDSFKLCRAVTETFCWLFQMFVWTGGLQLQRRWVTVANATAATVGFAPLHAFAGVFAGSLLSAVVVSVILGTAFLASVILFVVLRWDPVTLLMPI